MNSTCRVNKYQPRSQNMAGNIASAGLWDRPPKCYKTPLMVLAKPTFPAPDHDHGRCTADALDHAERVCERRAQKITPIPRPGLQALLFSHRPPRALQGIDELAETMPWPGPVHGDRCVEF